MKKYRDMIFRLEDEQGGVWIQQGDIAHSFMSKSSSRAVKSTCTVLIVLWHCRDACMGDPCGSVWHLFEAIFCGGVGAGSLSYV